MNATIGKHYIIYTEMGYFSGYSEKYADIIEFSPKRYAYVYETKEDAEVKAKSLVKACYDIVEIKEVVSNYVGKWIGGCFIVSEQYNDCELGLNNC